MTHVMFFDKCVTHACRDGLRDETSNGICELVCMGTLKRMGRRKLQVCDKKLLLEGKLNFQQANGDKKAPLRLVQREPYGTGPMVFILP